MDMTEEQIIKLEDLIEEISLKERTKTRDFFSFRKTNTQIMGILERRRNKIELMKKKLSWN